MDQQQLPYGAQPNIQANPYQSQQNPLFNIVLTPEEIKILNECRSNAIYHRGLPMGAAMAGGCYYMMNKGIVKRNMWGMALSGIAGFFIGTMSYRGICMEKLLSLPNSTLKDRILAAQGMQPRVRVDVNTGENFFDSILPSSDTPQGSSFDVEPYQSNQLDSYDFRPVDAETAYAVNPPLQPAQRETYTTYDELRRRNRDDYYRGNSIQSGPRGPAPPPSSSLYSPPSPSNAPSPYNAPLQQGPPQSASSYGATGFYSDRPPEYASIADRTFEQRQRDDQRQRDEQRW
ncbi:OCIA domain-containing protein 1 [Chelonus insularis]|uniref:OCIA domain-containing protein 1 n=1 Tax=Chelonus insularis TaxID=460826 RepID=UPI00158EC60D|nr:OCIA domain-containing protein 1 [Chelonus insularis]